MDALVRPLTRRRVEGTGSYGAGLARHLAGEQVKVIEVNRPDRRQRRTKGKSDPVGLDYSALVLSWHF
jgi:predicted dinucleotide-binding enzyme